MPNVKLTGILPPMITPVDDAGRFDEDTMRSYVDWLIDRGVDGLFPNGSTGEFTRFSPAVRCRIAQVVVEAAAGRVPVVAGIGDVDVQTTVQTCGFYRDIGVTTAIVVSPFYFQLSQPGVAAYFADVAEKSPLDLFLYNIPVFATPIEVSTVVDLATTQDRIVGIKDSSGSVPNMMRMVAAIKPQRPEFALFTGFDGLLATMRSVGADGGMVASAGVVPEVTATINRLYDAGDLAGSLRLQGELLKLFDTLLAVPEFPEGFRLAATSRGLSLGRSRTPLSADQSLGNDAAAETIGESVTHLVGLAAVK